MAAACAAVLDDDEPEPLRPQKTCYEVNGVTLSVDGFAYRQDPRGGNLSAHGKATGEAFWPADLPRGLYPMFISVETGKFSSNDITLGARADSL